MYSTYFKISTMKEIMLRSLSKLMENAPLSKTDKAMMISKLDMCMNIIAQMR